jgi:hypothetical protein
MSPVGMASQLLLLTMLQLHFVAYGGSLPREGSYV